MRLDIKILQSYSDPISKEQLIKACHMSKRTASYLLESKLLPARNTGKKTRCYQIKKKDVIEFFNDYSVMPEKYSTPPKWYSEKKQITTKPYRTRLKSSVINQNKLRKYYEKKLSSFYKDVLTLAEVSQFTGYKRKTVSAWIRDGKLQVIPYRNSYIVPQIYLLDWITSTEYNDIVRKSNKHTNALWGVRA